MSLTNLPRQPLRGQQIAALAFSNAVTNIVGIATKGAGGNANVLAVNSDVSNPVVITPDQSANWSTANVLQIKGTLGTTSDTITLAGYSVEYAF